MVCRASPYRRLRLDLRHAQVYLHHDRQRGHRVAGDTIPSGVVEGQHDLTGPRRASIGKPSEHVFRCLTTRISSPFSLVFTRISSPHAGGPHSSSTRRTLWTSKEDTSVEIASCEKGRFSRVFILQYHDFLSRTPAHQVIKDVLFQEKLEIARRWA